MATPEHFGAKTTPVQKHLCIAFAAVLSARANRARADAATK
jgi:hypothetical protein